MRFIAKMLDIRAWKIKNEGYWDLLNADNWKSQNICNFQVNLTVSSSSCIEKVTIRLLV